MSLTPSEEFARQTIIDGADGIKRFLDREEGDRTSVAGQRLSIAVAFTTPGHTSSDTQIKQISLIQAT